MPPRQHHPGDQVIRVMTTHPTRREPGDQRKPRHHRAGKGDEGMSSELESRTTQGTLLTQSSAVVRAATGLDSRASQCELSFLDNEFRCAQPAVAYVEFHMV